jgi:hypothetical protein
LIPKWKAAPTLVPECYEQLLILKIVYTISDFQNLCQLLWYNDGRPSKVSTSSLAIPCNWQTPMINGSTNSSLTPKCQWHHFMAYEWQWSGLCDKGRQFFIHWFFGSVLGQLCTTSNKQITMWGLFLSVRINFAKKYGWPYSILFFKLVIFAKTQFEP